MQWLETVLVVARPWNLALAKFVALLGLGMTASLVQWLGQRQKKSPSTVTSVTMLAAAAYTAALIGALVLVFSTPAWRVPAGLALLLLAAVFVFLARRMWRRPAQTRPIGSTADSVTAQVQGAVETVWLKGASTGADDAAWPQLTRVASPRDLKALIASRDFLGANEHALYHTRLFFGRAIPEMADASVVVTEARVLFTDGQQVFAVPRTRLRAISYREKEIMTLRAKREAIVFTYATESGDRELIGFDPGVIFWSGRAAKTHQTFDLLRAVLTTGTEPQAAA
jgi:hypothetical protein